MEAADREGWTLEVGGLVAAPFQVTLVELRSMASEIMVADIHCVTRWSKQGLSWTGIQVRQILDRAGVLPEARFVRFSARTTKPDGHHTTLPLEVVQTESVLLAWAVAGDPLPLEHGGPLRSVVPSRYFYKSIKWLARIELLAEDMLGTWEQGGYHNRADPWAEERYTGGSLKTTELARLRRDLDFSAWVGVPIISCDLSGLDLAGRDLRGLILKDCDLRGVDLSGATLRDCNLTNCDMRGARLRGVRMVDCDLDGVDLSNADLREADLVGVLANGITFVSPGQASARVTGMNLRLAPGTAAFLPEQIAFLRQQGVELDLEHLDA